MTDSVPSWLATMRELDHTSWKPTDAPNPEIRNWLGAIASSYPNMRGYCDSVIDESYFSWCGLTVGYCMDKAGIAPVFGDNDTSRFLYAAAWLGWGVPVTTPEPGDVLVFDFGNGDHHVTLFEKDNGDGTYSCHGGNQAHEVKLSNYPRNRLMGIRRPPANGGAPAFSADTLTPGAVGRLVTSLQSALAANGFDPGGIDGEYGPLTSAAVSNYQRRQNLPVTGVADPATLKSLGLSTEDGPRPNVATGGATMPEQDLLKALVGALIAKQAEPPPVPATPVAGQAQAQADMTRILQSAILALAGKPLSDQPVAGSASPTPAATPSPTLSIIDQIFGGQSLVGKKTMLAVIAYAILAILQATGVVGAATGPDATAAGGVLTTLIGAFGALGGLAKIDRLTQTLGAIANESAPRK